MKRATIIRLFSLCLLVMSVLSIDKHFDTSSASLSREAARDLSGESAVGYLKQAGLFDRVKAAVEASRYEIYRQTGAGAAGTDATHHANNPAQTLQASFTPNGVEMEPSAGSSQQSWQMRMKFAGIGYGQTLCEISTGSARVNGNRIEIPHSNVTEWYVNKPEGIEQGFTVAERPGISSNGDPLRVALEITGGLRARLEEGGQAAILERNDGTEVVRYDHLAAFDNRGRSLSAWMEAGEGGLSLLVDDSNAEYPLTIDPIFTLLVKVKTVTASDSVVGNPTGFGNRIAISGNTIVVAAAGAGPDYMGAVYVFDREAGGNGNWGEVKKLTASDGAAEDLFGGGNAGFRGIAISGDTIVVGAPMKGNQKGAAYVFQRNHPITNNWGEIAKLLPNGQTGFFGAGVGVSGDTVVVRGSGEAFVYVRNEGGDNNWGMVKRLGGYAGTSVSISGNNIVLGNTPNEVVVFYRNSGGLNNWGEVKKVTLPQTPNGIQHAISGDTIVVGRVAEGPHKVWIYGRNKGGTDNWGLIKELSASDNGYGFGHSVDINGDTAVVGAWCCFIPVGGTEPGKAVYIFRRDEGGVDNWGEVQKLTDPYDKFGWSVATNGYTVVAGNDESADIFSTLLSITTMEVSVLPELPPADIKIAQVFELDHASQTMTVKINGKESARLYGVSVSDLVVDPRGAVTARVGAACGATSASFTVEATNGKGETVTNTLTVTVSDTAPTITLKRRSIEMWPANGRYGLVTVSDMVAAVNDQCSTSLNVNDVKIRKVTSDEPDDAPGEADGNTTGDIIIGADCQSVRLRSERDVTKNGRVYSITLLVRDSSGNSARAVYKVTVPTTQFGTPAVMDRVAQKVRSNCR